MTDSIIELIGGTPLLRLGKTIEKMDEINKAIEERNA